MKVICINNENVKLTIGKSYDVISIIDIIDSSIQYLLKNDEGATNYYKSERFIDLVKFREDKLKNLDIWK